LKLEPQESKLLAIVTACIRAEMGMFPQDMTT